jgi:hypothetical protein
MVRFLSGVKSEAAVRFFRGKFAADLIAFARAQIWMYDYNDVVWR